MSLEEAPPLARLPPVLEMKSAILSTTTFGLGQLVAALLRYTAITTTSFKFLASNKF
jgi:hypothetical protein